jgi:hypothetical protein
LGKHGSKISFFEELVQCAFKSDSYVKVGVPFNESVQKGLEKTAVIVAKACPTGALALFGVEEQM